MMKLNKFDAPSLRDIRVDLQAAIASVEAKYGIKLTAGRAKYSEKSASMTIDMATFTSDGQIVDREREFLLANLNYLGLKAEHLERTILLGNDTFKLKGYNTRRYAKPFSVVSMTTGKTYVAGKYAVLTALGVA